jgi:hypothetical protein
MPTLIYQKTGQPVNVGDVIHSNGRPVIVCGWTEPRHPASTGRSRFKQWTNAKAGPSISPMFSIVTGPAEPTANPRALGPF